MSATTGLDSMSVAPRLSRAVQKLERWALHKRSETHESVSWEKINPRTDLKVLTYKNLSSSVPDHDKCKILLNKLVVVEVCGILGRALGSTDPKLSIEVREGQSFIDLIVQHIEALNCKYNAQVLLILATSDNTHKSTTLIVKKYSSVYVDISTFNQTEYPRDVWPVKAKLGEDGGYLTNNGDLFAALAFSGKLEELVAQGKEYLFIANADNLGATVDLNILNHLFEIQSEYCIEVTPKTVADSGGWACVSTEGIIELLEFEEVGDKHIEKPKSSDLKVLNTSNMWVKLKAIKRLAEIDALEIYCSVKVTEEDEGSFQLQTAGGTPLSVKGDILDNLPVDGNSDLFLVQFFDGPVAVNVPRSRFIPVKSTADLLLVQSNLYELKEGTFHRSSLRVSDDDPSIDLEGLKLKKIADFCQRFENTPSLLGLQSLKVIGDVWFGKDIALRGKVVIGAKKGDQIEIPDGITIEDKLVTAGPVYTDLSLADLDLECAQWSQERECDPDTFEEEDFPSSPPDWLELDVETYERRKNELVGKPVWVQDVQDEDLQQLGYSSWKAYVVESCMTNW